MKQEIKISKEVEVVHSICSMSDTNDDIDTYAQSIINELKTKNPNKKFSYEVDYDNLDTFDGTDYCWIYEEEK